MKKYISLLLVLICIAALTACGTDKKINLPEAEKVMKIEITKNDSEQSKIITDKGAIREIISNIRNTEDTGKESVNDTPVNIENYTILRFISENEDENHTVLYSYKVKNKTFIEQPYSGIWSAK